VQIDGDIVGDCVAVVINGAEAVTVTGVVNNTCTGAVGDQSPDLSIIGGTELRFTGAALTSTGDITLGDDQAALPSPGGAPSRTPDATSAAQGFVNCFFELFSAQIVSAGAAGASGTRVGGHGRGGSSIDLKCFSMSLRGVSLEAGDGGDGGDAENPSGFALAGRGGDGGSVTLSSSPGRLLLENSNSVILGRGGKGGDAVSDEEAEGGAGGAGGGFDLSASFQHVVEGSGTLDIFRSDGGDGGNARATGRPGVDASAMSAATSAGTATAKGGVGGHVNEVIVLADWTGVATVNEPSGGNGGEALVFGDKGGAGNREFPQGGDGPILSSLGGGGGSVSNALDPVNNLPDGSGVDGSGGVARVVGGSGGPGWSTCTTGYFDNGGRGGDGGEIFGGAGLGRDAVQGPTIIEDAGNGGVSGDGVEEPTMGGPKGTDNLSSSASTTTRTNSFQEGEEGKLCTFVFDVTITVTSDPNDHETHIELTTVTMISAQILPDGKIKFTSADGIWIETNGDLAADVSFTTTGSGRAAIFDGVPVMFDGSVTVDPEGFITALNGTLVYDSSNSVLPPQPDPPDGTG